jgi:UTP--glucose-1-phosphate uridylyltransferase
VFYLSYGNKESRMKIKKAIIPVAGRGTRFLPATKETPKEMIPVLNIPMIHYVVEEAVKAGIEEIIFITSTGKESIENYFDSNLGLETFLDGVGKKDYLKLIKDISSMVNINTVRQKEQLGLGHAVLMGKNFIQEGESFAVLLGDDIIIGEEPVTRQLVKVSEANDNSPVIGVMDVPRDKTSKYGIVAGEVTSERTLKMTEMVEKPEPSKAPTTLATPGRYILNYEIFNILESIPRGTGGEYQLTDAINEMAKKQDVYAYEFYGKRYDTGSLEGYIEATIDFALNREDLREHTLNLMKDRVKG